VNAELPVKSVIEASYVFVPDWRTGTHRV
jgi:hypothetical protein